MNEHARIVIVGAGHGGGNLCAALRTSGHQGQIILVGDELMVPYHRPPLSKAYLKGAASAETLKLRPESWYNTNGIELRLGRTAKVIDPIAHTVDLDDGSLIGWDHLVLATGSRARRLSIPGAGLDGVLHLRSLQDADRLREVCGPRRRLAIVGGGYVGLEVAASAVAMGADVVLIEREERILSRVACAPLAMFFDAYHRARGVRIITGAQVQAFEGDAERVTGIRLGDGEVVACDAALIGVGVELCDGLAREAGLACEAGGVIVDGNGRTSVAGIYAIGDMTWRPMPLYDDRMFRLESVPNAVEQGRRVAADILGTPPPAHEVPWFWSDQYDLKLQIVGIPFDSHRLVVRGVFEEAKFAIFHLADSGRILAVEALNMPQEFMAGRTLVGGKRIVDPALLVDTTVPIKEILQRTQAGSGHTREA